MRWADGEAAVGPDNKTYTTLGYANGKGAVRGSRQDLRGVNTTHKNYRQQAAVLLPPETHGTEDVGKSDFIYSYLILFLSSLVSSS